MSLLRLVQISQERNNITAEKLNLKNIEHHKFDDSYQLGQVDLLMIIYKCEILNRTLFNKLLDQYYISDYVSDNIKNIIDDFKSHK